MYAYDFIFDGIHLSDFGFIVCEFDKSGGISTSNTGANIDFELVTIGIGKRSIVTNAKYSNCLSATMQICKNPNLFNDDEMAISSEEFRRLSRWLNRREFCWFHSFDWCDPQVVHPWLHASFTLKKIIFADEIIGIELKMTTDSPFGYGEEIEETVTFTNGSLSKTFKDMNEEIGETFPELEITCSSAGALTLTDDVTGCSCEIEGCTSGEIINMSGDTLVLTTSVASHDIANNFNYEFFSFGNTYNNNVNTITSSIPCVIKIKYRPIWKDTI